MDKIYILEWRRPADKPYSWRFMFAAESAQAAKDYIERLSRGQKISKWYCSSSGYEMARAHIPNSEMHESFRIRPTRIVKEGEW